MASELATMECKACEGSPAALKGDKLKHLHQKLGGDWKIIDGEKLQREYKFPDFRKALEFVNLVGEIAEQQNHHPDIYFTWGQAKIQIWTHSAKGLTENDFILAAKISELK